MGVRLAAEAAGKLGLAATCSRRIRTVMEEGVARIWGQEPPAGKREYTPVSRKEKGGIRPTGRWNRRTEVQKNLWPPKLEVHRWQRIIV